MKNYQESFLKENDLDECKERNYLFSDKNIQTYLKEIRQIPLLTKEEEYKLASELQNLKKQLEDNHITDEYIEKELRKLGFNSPILKDKNSLEKQIQYLLALERDKKTELELIRKELTQNKNQNIHDTSIKVDEISRELDMIKQLIDDLKITKTYRTVFEKMCNSNLRLVVFIANRYKDRGMPMSDLISEGNLGLMRAVEKFDVTKGYRFSTYAVFWIRYFITRGIENQTRTIRLSVSKQEELRKLLKTQREILLKTGRQPSIESLAKELGIIEKKKNKLRKNRRNRKSEYEIEQEATKLVIKEIEQLKNDTLKIISLDEEIIEETYGDFFALETSTPESLTEQTFFYDALEKVFSKANLNERERKILIYRFGLYGEPEKTLKEIGKIYGVTGWTIGDIVSRALDKLKRECNAKYLRGFYNYNNRNNSIKK